MKKQTTTDMASESGIAAPAKLAMKAQEKRTLAAGPMCVIP